MSLYRTRSADVATYLVHTLGKDSHLRTFRGRDGLTHIELDDPQNRCAGLVAEFHGTGATVSSPKDLLAVNRSIRATMAVALRQGGEWRSDD